MGAKTGSEAGRGYLGVAVAGVLLAGLLVAIPFVFIGRGQTERTQTALDALGQANDVSAQAALQTAMTGAQVYFAENATYVGFDPSVASGFDPTGVYSLSPVAVSGQISIRGVTPTTIVFVTASGSGAVLCIGANVDVVSFGRVDASSPAACTGGWE